MTSSPTKAIMNNVVKLIVKNTASMYEKPQVVDEKKCAAIDVPSKMNTMRKAVATILAGLDDKALVNLDVICAKHDTALLRALRAYRLTIKSDDAAFVNDPANEADIRRTAMSPSDAIKVISDAWKNDREFLTGSRNPLVHAVQQAVASGYKTIVVVSDNGETKCNTAEKLLKCELFGVSFRVCVNRYHQRIGLTKDSPEVNRMVAYLAKKAKCVDQGKKAFPPVPKNLIQTTPILFDPTDPFTVAVQIMNLCVPKDSTLTVSVVGIEMNGETDTPEEPLLTTPLSITTTTTATPSTGAKAKKSPTTINARTYSMSMAGIWTTNVTRNTSPEELKQRLHNLRVHTVAREDGGGEGTMSAAALLSKRMEAAGDKSFFARACADHPFHVLPPVSTVTVSNAQAQRYMRCGGSKELAACLARPSLSPSSTVVGVATKESSAEESKEESKSVPSSMMHVYLQHNPVKTSTPKFGSSATNEIEALDIARRSWHIGGSLEDPLSRRLYAPTADGKLPSYVTAGNLAQPLLREELDKTYPAFVDHWNAVVKNTGELNQMTRDAAEFVVRRFQVRGVKSLSTSSKRGKVAAPSKSKGKDKAVTQRSKRSASISFVDEEGGGAARLKVVAPAAVEEDEETKMLKRAQLDREKSKDIAGSSSEDDDDKSKEKESKSPTHDDGNDDDDDEEVEGKGSKKKDSSKSKGKGKGKGKGKRMGLSDIVITDPEVIAEAKQEFKIALEKRKNWVQLHSKWKRSRIQSVKNVETRKRRRETEREKRRSKRKVEKAQAAELKKSDGDKKEVADGERTETDAAPSSSSSDEEDDEEEEEEKAVDKEEEKRKALEAQIATQQQEPLVLTPKHIVVSQLPLTLTTDNYDELMHEKMKAIAFIEAAGEPVLPPPTFAWLWHIGPDGLTFHERELARLGTNNTSKPARFGLADNAVTNPFGFSTKGAE